MKRMIKQLLVLCGAGLFVLLSACGKRTDVADGDDFIYCLNESMTGLVKVSFELPDEDAKGQVAAVLEELAKPAEDIEYMQVISDEVKVNSFEVKNVIVNVDLSSAYLEIPTVSEKLVRAALVRSLLQVSGIQAVRLTVEGKPLTGADGAAVGILNGDDFVENTGASVSSYQNETLTLYFANKEGDKLIRRMVNVRYSSNVPREKIIVEKLMQGPKGSSSYPTLNPEATLLSVTVKDGVCYVNFDSEFLNSTYNVKPETAIYSLVNSLLEGTTAEKVQIAVNGVTDVSYKDTIDLSQPFGENLELVEKAGEK